MKNILFIAVALLMFQWVAFSQPVIINDTGDWDGEIKADEQGFLVYDNGMWTQRGANYKDEIILSFLDDFSPLISGSGMNNIMCAYYDIGWIWPTTGRNATGFFQVLTTGVVYDHITTIQATNVDYLNISLTGVKAKDEYPSDGHFDINRTINVSISNIAAVSSSVSWLSTGSALVAFVPSVNMPASICSVCLDLLSRYLGNIATITNVVFGTYDNLAPLQLLVNDSDIWELRGFVKASILQTKMLLYDDYDADGYVADKDYIVTKYVPIYTDFSQFIEFHKIEMNTR